MGMKTGFFYEYLDANGMKPRVFERMDVFSTKYGHESDKFLENGHFFTKYGHDSSDFFVKNGRKKWYPIDIFGP